MADQILIKRGLLANLPTLAESEFGHVNNTGAHELYLGTSADGNKKIPLYNDTNQLLADGFVVGDFTFDIGGLTHSSGSFTLSANGGAGDINLEGYPKLIPGVAIRFENNSDANLLSLQGPDTLTGGSYTIKLPNAAPASGAFLHYDGTNYVWSTTVDGGTV